MCIAYHASFNPLKLFRMIHESFQFLTQKKKDLLEELRRKKEIQDELERAESELNETNKA